MTLFPVISTMYPDFFEKIVSLLSADAIPGNPEEKGKIEIRVPLCFCPCFSAGLLPELTAADILIISISAVFSAFSATSFSFS